MYCVLSPMLGAIMGCQRIQESGHRKKRKKHLNSLFYNLVPYTAIALLVVNALGVAGIQILALPWIASAPRDYSTATSGSTCSVQTALLGRDPSRCLQPDYFLRQELDSWETHILVPAYKCWLPYHWLHPTHRGCPWGRLQPGRRQSAVSFHLEPQPPPNVKLPKDSLLHRAPSSCTKTGLISCCTSVNIPSENVIVSSPCCHLQFLCIVLLEHPLSFTFMGKGATPSPFFPIKKKGKIKYFISSSCNSYRFQASASIQNGALGWVWKDHFEHFSASPRGMMWQFSSPLGATWFLLTLALGFSWKSKNRQSPKSHYSVYSLYFMDLGRE